ncbi:hypothetical protein SDC9_98830 [bioreactor metagenome]|uniref:Uncharacterized protein n=1 Tax=bioreactor metagenome TaxID=1076179 RepID=A0A645AGD5_9ZZZZ
MDDVEVDRAHARVIMRVQLGDAGAVLPLPRELHADKIDEFKGISAAKPGVRHRRYHIALLAAPGQRGCIVIDHAAYAVYDWQKGIAKLSNFHWGFHTFRMSDRQKNLLRIHLIQIGASVSRPRKWVSYKHPNPASFYHKTRKRVMMKA